MTAKLFIRIEYDAGTVDEYEILWTDVDSLVRRFLANPNVAAVTFTVEGSEMNEKTYPDEEGYDPTVGMGEKIQRFEYLVWFKGEYISPNDIANAIKAFLETKNVEPLQAQYGTVMVPDEDVGEGPYCTPRKARLSEISAADRYP